MSDGLWNDFYSRGTASNFCLTSLARFKLLPCYKPFAKKNEENLSTRGLNFLQNVPSNPLSGTFCNLQQFLFLPLVRSHWPKKFPKITTAVSCTAKIPCKAALSFALRSVGCSIFSPFMQFAFVSVGLILTPIYVHKCIWKKQRMPKLLCFNIKIGVPIAVSYFLQTSKKHEQVPGCEAAWSVHSSHE